MPQGENTRIPSSISNAVPTVIGLSNHVTFLARAVAQFQSRMKTNETRFKIFT